MDIHPQGRNLMQSFAEVPHIFSNTTELVAFISNALHCSIHGYYVTVPALYSRADNNRYFRYQLEIIQKLKAYHKLSMIAFQMHPCTTRSITDKFESELELNNWIISKQCCKFPEFGDSIDGSSTFLFGLNSQSNPTPTKIQVKIPPSVPASLGQHLMNDYDVLRYSLIEEPSLIDVPAKTIHLRWNQLLIQVQLINWRQK